MRESNLGVEKKSFALYYNGGEIWAEHLDRIDNEEDMREKWEKDLKVMARPSISSFAAINLAQSPVNTEFLEDMLSGILSCNKSFQRIAFIGLERKMKKYVNKHEISSRIVIRCIDDYEKAKQWLV